MLGSYKHLREVNLSNNDIVDLSEAARLDYLVSLQAHHNKIDSIRFFGTSPAAMQFLQTVDLSNNRITELSPIPQPKVLHVNLDSNLIETCSDFHDHANLKTLSLNKNKLASVTGLGNFPQLQDLQLSKNQLSSLMDLNNVPNLRKLNLNGNKFESLADLPDMP